MKRLILGAHLEREDVEPLAEAIEVGSLFLSSIPLEEEQPVGDRGLLLHAASVRAALLERATFVAIRYGFTVRSAEEANTRCSASVPAWRTLLESHRDEVEMTLKMVGTSPRERPRREEFSSGAAYLRALHDSSRNIDVDSAFRAGAEVAMKRIATETRWVDRDSSSIEMAFLVRRASTAEVAAAGAQLKRDFPSTPFLLSGPWPLEIFADADHE